MLPKTRTTGHKSNKNNGNGNKKKHSTLATHTTCQKTERESEKRGNCPNWGKIPKSMQYFFPVGPSTFRGSLLTWQARHSN